LDVKEEEEMEDRSIGRVEVDRRVWKREVKENSLRPRRRRKRRSKNTYRRRFILHWR
jgi:hypothetical protein